MAYEYSYTSRYNTTLISLLSNKKLSNSLIYHEKFAEYSMIYLEMK